MMELGKIASRISLSPVKEVKFAQRPAWLCPVWSGPAMGARPLADFGTAECRILTELRQDRKLVSLSPYERRPNPHIGLPGHNGAGQNRKQDLPFSSHKEVKFAQRLARLSSAWSGPPACRMLTGCGKFASWHSLLIQLVKSTNHRLTSFLQQSIDLGCLQPFLMI